MLLDLPTKSLEVSLGVLPTQPLSLVLEYTAGLPAGTSPQIRNQTLLAIAAAGATQVVPAPSVGQQFEITHLSLYNANPVALVAAIQIRLTPGGGAPTSVFIKYQATLQPGDNLFYQANNHGFFVVDSTGSVRGVVPLPLGAATEVTLAALLAALGLVQGATTSGSKGPMVQAAVENTPPHLLPDILSPVSVDQNRALRVLVVGPNLEGALAELTREIQLLRFERTLETGISA